MYGNLRSQDQHPQAPQLFTDVSGPSSTSGGLMPSHSLSYEAEQDKAKLKQNPRKGKGG